MGRATGFWRAAAATAVACAVFGVLAQWPAAFPAAWSFTLRADSPGQEDAPKPYSIAARKYAFSPDRIEVEEGDLVKVTLSAEDVPHSFAIDAYRIVKRASPGHPAVFEFRADQAGTFPFYCNITSDDGCKNMRGQLIVRPKKR